MNDPVAQPLPRLQPTPFGGGTPCGKGGDHAHRLSASPKGGREWVEQKFLFINL